MIFIPKDQLNQCKKSYMSSQSVDCSRSNVTGCRPFVTDLSLNESLIRSHLKRDFKAKFNFIKTIKKQWCGKHESNQVHKSSFGKFKHKKNSYRVTGLVITGLSTELRAIPSSIKTFYAE